MVGASRNVLVLAREPSRLRQVARALPAGSRARACSTLESAIALARALEPYAIVCDAADAARPPPRVRAALLHMLGDRAPRLIVLASRPPLGLATEGDVEIVMENDDHGLRDALEHAARPL